jgi:lipopolysaccharide transport system ATP-binding protein
MSRIAVRAEGLAKQYRLGGLGARYATLRDTLVGMARRRRQGPERATIWALDGVSFEVAEGEILGLIGRNGAGKTTLLRVLSRITEPTRGWAEVRGRIGSLLEVGTGFHPELTGRENVFLNGAILGMGRREIAAKLDEIVAFAGVEKFVDTPVKRFSTGMQVRLAFAVAAHLEPEILLVDEVLAVGDAEFQKRCLGKMESIGRSGRTVLFVSHNMQAVTRLCDRAILLDAGRVQAHGPVEDVVSAYLHGAHGGAAVRAWPRTEAPGNDLVRLVSVRVVDTDGRTVAHVDVRRPVRIELVFEVLREGAPFVPWLALYSERGEHIFSTMDTDPAWRMPREPGRYTVVSWIPEHLLNEGAVAVSVSLNTFQPGGKATRHAHVDHAVSFQVMDPGEGDTARGHYGATWPGPVRPLLQWSTSFESVIVRS